MRLIRQKLEHREFQQNIKKKNKKIKEMAWGGQTLQEFSQESYRISRESYGISILKFIQNWAEELLINLI